MMGRSVQEQALRPFNASGYEILDEDLLTTGELVIWSIAPLIPRIGDLFTIESQGGVHEVKVDAIVTVAGGWSARCKLFGLCA